MYSIPLFLILFVITFQQANKLSLAAIFFVSVIITRYLLSFIPEYTFSPLVGSFSIISLFSLVFGLAAILFILKYYRRIHPIPVIQLMVLSFLLGVVITSILTNHFTGGIIVFMKWVLGIGLALSLFYMLNTHGIKRTFNLILPIWLVVLFVQFFGTFLGYNKATELDVGSISYIGSFFHEGAFSQILLGGIFVLTIKMAISFKKLDVLFFVLFLIGLFMANYRTSILAVLVFLLSLFWFSLYLFSFKNRIVLFVLSLLFAAFAYSLVDSNFIYERFSDISLLNWALVDSILEGPEYLYVDEGRLMSHRIFIWSDYLSTYLNGGLGNMLFGFGPESATSFFEKRPHNEYIAFLFEFGIMGFIWLLIFYSAGLYYSFKIPVIFIRNSTIAFQLALIVYSIAGEPLWGIEGFINFALLWGVILYGYSYNFAKTIDS